MSDNKLSDDDIKSICRAIKSTVISLTEIAVVFNVQTTVVTAINNGKLAKKISKEFVDKAYPLRERANISKKLTAEDLDGIIYDLLKTTLTQKEISEKYEVCQQTVSDVNLGKKAIARARGKELKLFMPLRPRLHRVYT